jgi:CSLREA domain-containing protein
MPSLRSPRFGVALTSRSPLALIVALVVSISLLTSPFFLHVARVAPSDTKLIINASRSVAVGEPIELRLMLVNARNVGGFETALLFDSTAMAFQDFEYHDSDLKRQGRALEPLATVEAPYGAAFGLVSCSTEDCDGSQKPGNAKGPNGNVQLMRVTLVANQPGQVEIVVGDTKVVDADGNPLSVDVQERSLTIRVGAPHEGPTFPAPASPWSLPPSNVGEPGPFDMTESGDVSRADLLEVAIEWSLAREKSAPCGDHLDLSRDVNGDGCVDIADLTLVAANLGYEASVTSAQFAVASGAEPEIYLLQSSTNLTFTVNSTGDEPDANIGNRICQTAAGTCTLRAAIQEANNYTGASTINFNISGGVVQTIRLRALAHALARQYDHQRVFPARVLSQHARKHQ